MGLILNAPQPAVVPMPAPRLTSYRYWEDYAPKYLRAIRDTVARVIDDQERQRDLFEEAPAAAPPRTGRAAALGRRSRVPRCRGSRASTWVRSPPNSGRT